jgi:hypothetical protein
MTETTVDFNEKHKTISQWLYNPFYFLAGSKALGIGIIIIMITGCLAYLEQIRFNGLIDFHFLPSPFWLCISDGLVSWFVLSILLLIAGKIVSKSQFRIVDVAGTQALARFPYLFITIAAAIPGVSSGSNRFTQALISNPFDLPAFSINMLAFIFIIIVCLIMAVWMIALMYRAFAVSCNVVGKKAVTAFIIAIIIGEIISAIFLYQLPKAFEKEGVFTPQAANFVTMLSSGEYKAAEKMFDETMKASLPEKKLKEAWESLATQFGPFKAQGATRQTNIQGYDVIFVSCEFEKVRLDCQIAFDFNGKISGLYFRPSTNKK